MESFKQADTNFAHTITSSNILVCSDTDRVVGVFYHDYDIAALLGNDVERKSKSKVKIIQMLAGEENAKYQGVLLGLGDDGVIYAADGNGWNVYVPLVFNPINERG